jgi:hypothetical protein
VVVLGIEGAAFAMGAEMTPAVTESLDALVTAALDELEGETPCTSAL